MTGTPEPGDWVVVVDDLGQAWEDPSAGSVHQVTRVAEYVHIAWRGMPFWALHKYQVRHATPEEATQGILGLGVQL